MESLHLQGSRTGGQGPGTDLSGALGVYASTAGPLPTRTVRGVPWKIKSITLTIDNKNAFYFLVRI